MNFLPMSTAHLAEKRFGRLLLIVVAFGLAAVYEVLAYKHWDGIGAFLFVLFVSAVVIVIGKYYNLFRNKWAFGFLVFPVVLSLDLVLYNNDLVRALAPLLIILSLFLFIFTLTVGHPETKTVFRFRKLPIPNLFRGIWKAIQDLTESPTQERKRVFVKVLIGLIIALPLVLIFGSLFADADRNFEAFIQDIFYFNIDEDLLFRIIRIGFIGILMTAIFYAVLDSKYVLKGADKVARKLDSTIILTILVILNALFITFVFIQFKHLFVSYQYVVDNNIVFSQFARSGFFQLLWASGFVLLLFLIIFRSFSEHGMGLWLKGFLGLFLVQTVIVAYSALHRLNLYQEAYGFTVQRFYAEIIIYFVMVSLVLGIVWIFTHWKFARLFYAGSILAAVSLMIGMSVNVDGVIARKNLDRAFYEGKTLDVYYLRTLSLDASPVFYDRINSEGIAKLPYAEQAVLLEVVDRYNKNDEPYKYLDFNFGRYQAKEANWEFIQDKAGVIEQKNRIDSFKNAIDAASKNSVNSYFGSFDDRGNKISYKIITKFYVDTYSLNNKGWAWPPHLTFVRFKPEDGNYHYVNDVILFTDEEYLEMRKDYARSRSDTPYVFLLNDGSIAKFNPKDLTQETYKVRFNGSKFEIYIVKN